MPPGVTTVSSRMSEASSRTIGARWPLVVRRARVLAAPEALTLDLLSAGALVGDSDSAVGVLLVGEPLATCVDVVEVTADGLELRRPRRMLAASNSAGVALGAR